METTISHKGMSVEQIEGVLERPLADLLKHIPYSSSVIDENVEFFPYKYVIGYIFIVA